MSAATSDTEAEETGPKALLKRLGPGLITGAADDDPSGIATYSQAGAQFGLSMLWAVVVTYPLMAAVQSVSARIGRVTGRGLAANMLEVFPRPVVMALVAALFVANTINIGADLAAMGAAARLVSGLSEHAFTIGFAVASLLLQVLAPYHRYVKVLKWLTMALFAYVGVVFAVKIDWAQVAHAVVFPNLVLSGAALTVIVAVFGTTISPYLFFWQSSEEVEDEEASDSGPLRDHPRDAKIELTRIRWDTLVGMAFSNLIAFFIILTTAVTLHVHGVTDIQTSAQAAQALRPVAGPAAFFLFSIGVIGTGLLAVPVLAGSVGYAAAETFGWRSGLELKANEAKGFYLTIAASVVVGLAVDYSGFDPIKALFWSAVLNAIISVPIMVAMMVVAGRKKIMGRFTASPGQVVFGWAATVVMAAAVAGMLLL
jgi:NRAMP (natural resistance-associated macrophage protein)-like metal ion transporter